MTLFLRRGLVAWMRAWPPEPAPSPYRFLHPEGHCLESGEKPAPASQTFPSQLYHSMAKLLADMVFQARQEVVP